MIIFTLFAVVAQLVGEIKFVNFSFIMGVVACGVSNLID
jgi:hypothetical protein